MSKTSINRNKGFTIIEVLIVLAIAGLILLIVFLAVPALQRNSRNTQRQNDVAAIGGALSEFVNNNNGVLPATDAEFDTGVKINYKVGFYDDTVATSIVYYKNASAATRTFPTGNEAVHIHSYTKCNGNATTATGASGRSLVAIYNVESGTGGSLAQCKEL